VYSLTIILNLWAKKQIVAYENYDSKRSKRVKYSKNCKFQSFTLSNDLQNILAQYSVRFVAKSRNQRKTFYFLYDNNYRVAKCFELRSEFSETPL